MPIVFLLVFSLFAAALPAPAMAQEIAVPPPQFQPVSDINFAERFLKEEREIWVSPFKLKRSDMKWLIPVGAGAAALLVTDHSVSHEMREADMQPATRFISKLGSAAPLALASGTLYGLGKLTHNEKAANTGKLATEAVLHSQLVVQSMKMIFNRERPDKPDGQGSFWGGGRSFPSGHAMSSFALATVVAHEYRHKPLIAVGAYGFATAVSLARVGGLNHFPSDVLIGATIGHLIGRFVLHRHKDDYQGFPN
jgi:hypothetical protein